MGLNFQDCASPSMRELRVFHDHVVVVISGVIVLISYIFLYLLLNKKYYKNLSEGTFIETVWSIVPAFLLIILVIPSIKVLYFIEEIKSPSLSFKVIAHQWYWTYVVPMYKNFSYKLGRVFIRGFRYDSMMEEGRPRLLSVSSRLALPMSTSSRL